MNNGKQPKNRAGKARRKKQNPPKKVSGVEKKVSLPVGSASGQKTKRPIIKNNRGSTVVSHSEYLFDLSATTTFALPSSQVKILQPGLVDSFPWLAQIAASYEMYRFRKVVFKYRNRISTGSSGAVYMAYQNDSGDSIFGSKAELMAYEGSQEQVIWVAQDFHVNIQDYMKKYFVRNTPLPDGDDPQLYDCGMFSITSIAGSNTYIGDVIVEYEVEFFKPKVSQALGAGYYAEYGSTGTSLTTLQQHPLTTGPSLFSAEIPYANYFAISVGGAHDLITFKMAGFYLVTGDWNSTTGFSNYLDMVSVGGDNIEIMSVKFTADGGASSVNIYTFYCWVYVARGGDGSENQMAISFTGGTATTSWTGNLRIVQAMPGEATPTPSPAQHPGLRRQQRSGKRPVCDRKEELKRTSTPPIRSASRPRDARDKQF